MNPYEVRSSDDVVVSNPRRVSPRKRQQVCLKDEQSASSASSTKQTAAKKPKPSKPNRVKTKSTWTNKDSAVSRPTPQECYFVTDALSRLHPHIVEENNKRREALMFGKQQLEHRKNESINQVVGTPVTDQIIGTMLSQNTTDANCHKAFANIKKDFPGGWDEVANVQDITRIENSIKVAGLAKTRAQRIHDMLQSIQAERGEANFEYLQRYESNDEIVKELSRFKGMGPKTISCVLLFALGRNDFPVDTHVLRITQMMSWVNKSATRESAYEHFKSTIPGDCMMDLHCLLVQHGKVCYNCAANGRPQFPPECGKARWVCPLIGIRNNTMDLSGYVSNRFRATDVRIKNETGIALKQEEITKPVKAVSSGVKVKVEHEESVPILNETAVSYNDIQPEETISDSAIKVEQT